MNGYLTTNHLKINVFYIFSNYIGGFNLNDEIVKCTCSNTHFKVLQIKKHYLGDNIDAECKECGCMWYFTYNTNISIAQIIFKKVVKV